MLVAIQVSSMKMRRVGFRAPWLSHQAARAPPRPAGSARRHEATFFEPQAEAIERAPQATEADRHPALGCQPITPIPRASRRAPHPGASATPAHGPRACGAGVRTAKSLVDVRN